MRTFRIREAFPDDNDDDRHELHVLHQLTFFTTADQPDLTVGYWWLVRDVETKETVAFAGLTPASYDANTGYLKRVGVLKEARGHGLQKRLLRVRERKARKLGWFTLLTDTTDNPPSANSLIAGGFKIFDPSYRWAFGHSIYWKKELL